MNLKLLSSLLLALCLGCAACRTNTGSLPAKSFNKTNRAEDPSVSRVDAQNFWLKKLEAQKPDLHAMTLLAMLLSKDTDKEIFVVAKTNQNRVIYLVTPVRGGSENLFSYSHRDNYFSFDHYNLLSNDGPSLADATYELEISRRAQAYYKELGVK